MARLPVPGSDSFVWGTLLNEYLSVEHTDEGQLKLRTDGTLDAFVNKDGAVTITGVKTFSSSPILPTPVSGTDAANKSYVDSVVASGAPNADATTPGLIQLTGALGGTYNNPALAADSVTNTTVAGGAAIAKSKLASLAIEDADVNTVSQSKITGLTAALAAKASLSGGLVPTSELGGGTASSSTFLRGDQTWQTVSSGSGEITVTTVGVTSSGADYECDGTSDNVQLQAAVDAVAVTGGIVAILPGTYNLAATLTITGTNSYDTPTVQLIGSGMHATKLNMASGVDGIHLTNNAQVNLSDLQIIVAGAGDGITATQSGSLLQSFWNSQFRNLYVTTSGVHTGYGMNIGSPFRSTFENIEIFNTHHGIRFYSEHADQNPGDCTVSRVFIECDNQAGSVALHLNSPAGLGSLNQMVFNMVEMIDNAGGGTGVLLDGSATVNHMVFIGLNNEQFATAINVDYGSSNTFDCNYVEVLTGGTFFKTGTNASGNRFTRGGLVFVGAKTATVINDANTWNENPNHFENFYIAVELGGTASATVTTGSTRIADMRGYNSGTMSPLLAFNTNDATETLLNKRIVLRDQTTATLYELYVDNGVLGIQAI